MLLEVGEQGVQTHPLKFWFAENLGKIPENPGKYSVQRCLTSKNGDQGLHKNTWRPFLEATPKKLLRDLCGRKFVGKSCTKILSGKFREIRAKILCTPKNLSAPTPTKRHFCPVAPLLKGQKGKCFRHASIFRRPCAYYPTLSLLVVVGYNVPL